MNILFICSRNQWRSPTAETVFKNQPGIHAKSAGTASNARIKISEKMVQWADLVFVMEKKHRIRLEEKFPEAVQGKEIIILDIPDEYQYMDPELIEILQVSVKPYL